ncbi:MAG: bifunctional 3-deoxy-7-phosphoheptulonate synthase/chorismate mutase type II [Bacteroidetes bacterium]|nr:bifunctional 3-deoxy-7-phosphoheptulonate synthase/chorismate mutase type II [Bacteroidota bacterium]HET6245501.1 chorismate mutase [Bacteroidia bacterium]
MKLDLTITPLNSWIAGAGKPLIISGPCSAETENQVLETAKAIAKTGTSTIFRAGIWKPRTRPNAFEGIGVKGLPWLKRVKQETGLLIATEVANAYHVEECLKYGIDMVWIGARTTANPFSVQEIADALKGVDIPVFVKNPIHPDLQLWIGALERINKAGITKLAAIHRGFHSYIEKLYRNTPNWELAIELKMLCPELPLICDPSHICGNTTLLFSVAQKAMDLDMDGLMIESHCAPQTALSDKDQQITPDELLELVSELVIRDASSKNVLFKNKLEELRSQIDNVDEEILLAMAERMIIVKEIGEYKKENSVTILQIKRWNKILKNQLKTAEKTGLSKEFIKDLYLLVHNESIRMQTEIMNRKEMEIKKS